MRAPNFWQDGGWASLALLPAAWVYKLAANLRYNAIKPTRLAVPVICVGNLTAGGAGKTPTALALLKLLQAAGAKPAALSRGFGGAMQGPLCVDPQQHSADEVGDEPLLLAQVAPTFVGKDRLAAARLALESGADCLVMDDGFQNSTLAKDLSLLVVDGSLGFGNGRVLPAGPLRESITAGLARADAVVLLGKAKAGLIDQLHGKMLLRATIKVSVTAPQIAGGRFLAFAGLAYPEKFFDTLRQEGAKKIVTRAFADHYPFRPEEVAALKEEAKRLGLRLITTEKDLARLAPAERFGLEGLPIELQWEDASAVNQLLHKALAR